MTLLFAVLWILQLHIGIHIQVEIQWKGIKKPNQISYCSFFLLMHFSMFKMCLLLLALDLWVNLLCERLPVLPFAPNLFLQLCFLLQSNTGRLWM